MKNDSTPKSRNGIRKVNREKTANGCIFDIDLFHPETYANLKDCRDLFDKNMARHLLAEIVNVFAGSGTINLDCLYEISRMSAQDVKGFFQNLTPAELSDHPVAQCFLECADDELTEGIFKHVRRVARQYIRDCTFHESVDLSTAEGP